MSRVDFGLQIEPQYGFSYEDIRGIAAESEKRGFESLWVSDHFFLSPELAETPCLECWTTLAALARDTSRLRLGAMVASQSYRNPALAAKMAASVDNLSSGRLNFGIGAGWKEVEYRAYGYPFPSPDARIRQLNESLEIAKRMRARRMRGLHTMASTTTLGMPSATRSLSRSLIRPSGSVAPAASP